MNPDTTNANPATAGTNLVTTGTDPATTSADHTTPSQNPVVAVATPPTNTFFEMVYSARYQRDPWNGEMESPEDKTVYIKTLVLAPILDDAKRLAEESFVEAFANGNLLTGMHTDFKYQRSNVISLQSMFSFARMGYFTRVFNL